jgi:hypothetical protein
MSLDEQLNILIDENGWAAFLMALDQIAEADGFVQLMLAIRPVRNLIDDIPGDEAGDLRRT